jgi:membrane protease YdiL (CAAX protease family)
MEGTFSLIKPGMEPFWSVVISTIAFLLYNLYSEKNVRQSAPGTDPVMGFNASPILIQRFLGLLLFGLIPMIVAARTFRLPLEGYGLNFLNAGQTLLWVVILSPVILLLNYLNASSPSNLAMYPQIREKHWSIRLLTASAMSWSAYLLAYEFMFRGFLLFSWYHAFGHEIAIAVNTSLYALVHLPKGQKETFGAIPLGIVLCLLTLHTGNIWIAVIVHIVMALSNEWMSIRAHPHIKIVRSK